MTYVTLVNDPLTHGASSPNWKRASKEKDGLRMINTSPTAQLEQAHNECEKRHFIFLRLFNFLLIPFTEEKMVFVKIIII